MKPNSGLTMALLARHKVSCLSEITRDMVKIDDLYIVNNHLSLEAKEIIADAAGIADAAIDQAVIRRDHPQFEEAGFTNSSEQELMAIGRIYGAHGREIDITEEGIVVHPRTNLQRRKKIKQETVAVA